MSNSEQINKTNKETFIHIMCVRSLLLQSMQELIRRVNEHDLSKLSEPEVDLFVEYTPRLKNIEYGSDEYKDGLKGLKPALDNHYAKNSHHPEHYENGINDMTIFDILEMTCDWKASSLRGKKGNFYKSLELQKDRFDISPQLYQVIKNTIPLIEQFTKESNIEINYLTE